MKILNCIRYMLYDVDFVIGAVGLLCGLCSMDYIRYVWYNVYKLLGLVVDTYDDVGDS